MTLKFILPNASASKSNFYVNLYIHTTEAKKKAKQNDDESQNPHMKTKTL